MQKAKKSSNTKSKTAKTETATFGAGCFWHVELDFSRVPGVISTEVGYEGGDLENPNYKDVCSDTTGHAEVIQLTFDSKKVSYSQLLDAFWKIHDPTQLNRQGPDTGTQYRTVIFYHSKEQKAQAEASKKAIQKKFSKPIMTAIVPAQTFYKAEEYHQKYLIKRGKESCYI